ncbi:MAG TPA: TIGR03435 family protein [Alphaproteobacteria bacterium]|nr:TIGR03435 family protein [Alphaproteobacteria bacterium]
MKKTNLMITVGVAILAAVAVAMAVEYQSGQIKDSYFADPDNLRQVPAGLVALRPTHFANTYGKIRHDHENDTLTRTVGRDASLRQIIADAYDCAPAQVVMPPGAPQGHFDFLVTKPGHVRDRLKKIIESQFHYIAHRESQNTDVFILTVSDPALPGLTPSADGEDKESGLSYRDGKLYFKHQTVSRIVDGLSQGLNEPVLDQTGLTNAYDFSLAWTAETTKRMENGGFSLAGTRRVLAGWGLALESSNVPMDRYVVTPAP